MSVIKKVEKTVKKNVKKMVRKTAKSDNDIHAQEKIEELKAQGQLDYGIVFCGGGAKGAFQLGVWKRLNELGIAERFTGVSGASVGALNALLFAQGDYMKAESAWMEMKKGDLMQINEVIISDLFILAMGIPDISKVIVFLKNRSESFGLLSRKKLKSIVEKYISFESLEDKLVYVSLSALTLRLNKFGNKKFLLKRKYTYLDPKDSIKKNIKKVLASAALPVAYSPVRVGRRIYMDGGIMDNTPVSPLIKAGYQNILVVHLKRRFNKDGKDRLKTFNKKLRKRFSEEELEGVTICHIWPRKSLKKLLKISPKLTQKRIKEGYEQASVQLDDSFFSSSGR